MRKIIQAILICSVFVACNSNDDCDDCLELDSKNIKIVDINGNNLLYGDSVIYEIDSVKLSDSEGNNIHLFQNESLGAINFALKYGYEKCFLELNSTEVDTLEFILAKRKSTSCCGYVTYATKTSVNGIEIATSNVIEIVK